MSNSHPDLGALRAAIQLACQPQNAWRIVAGRQQVLAMPRAWVLRWIEQVAAESLDLSDYWEYRRLLEVAEMLDTDLVQRIVAIGLSSVDPDVRKAAEDFRQ
jgi:hypothetical protein